MDDFRVYVIIEMPILDKKYELFLPIDRRIHDIIRILKNTIPELSENYLIVIEKKTERKQVGTRELSRGTLYMLGDQQRNN